MRTLSLTFNDRPCRQLGAAFAIALSFAVCGGASAAGPNLAIVTVSKTPSASKTSSCAKPADGWYLCVDPDQINTESIGSDDALIAWLIASPGWVFDKSKGIDIQKVHGKKDWKSDYIVETLYTAYNKKGTGMDRYKYTINVKKSDDSTPLAHDPTIMN